ncbi:MAG: phosphoenolpyruvate--protein phosphotransferase [Sandaracinaceae bacterium]|nr:phosphoenolpyruvate--protein phosphotransferase [Sandaracinaceae bacterium]
MSDVDDHDGPPTRPIVIAEVPPARALRGLPASPGVAIGHAVVFDRRSVPVARRSIAAHEALAELGRLLAAIARSRARLEALREDLDPTIDAEHRLVLDAHLLMVKDELLVSSAEAEIRGGKCAEWALRTVADDVVGRLAQAKESYLRDRAHDVEHVAEDVLRMLTGAGTELPPLAEAAVLVASDLSAAELLALPRDKVLAVVTELGTATGHTAILARALHVPTIVGVRGATRAVETGQIVIVDARRGELHVDPTTEARASAEDRADRYRSFAGRLRESRDARTALADGTRVELLANLEVEVELEEALDERAEGVGLYRTEFLYLDGSLPDEEHLTEVFARVGRAFAPRTVTLRTFDLGADKLPRGGGLDASRRLAELAQAPNPALGLRGLRLALEMPEVLRTQIRAVLRAAEEAPLRLMFPMVCTVEEMREARRVVDHARRELAQARVPHRMVPLGAMIEVPSAVVLADVLANECDFFSVGTNDLAQYALAIDRGDPTIASLASPMAPGLLRMLRPVMAAAQTRGIPVSLCGDMSSHPLAIPVLVGLGLRALSMPASEIPFARAVCARLDLRACEDVAKKALACATEAEVRRSIVARLGATLGDLWDEHGLVL